MALCYFAILDSFESDSRLAAALICSVLPISKVEPENQVSRPERHGESRAIDPARL